MDRETKSQTVLIGVAILALLAGIMISAIPRELGRATNVGSEATPPPVATAAVAAGQATAPSTDEGGVPAAGATSETNAQTLLPSPTPRDMAEVSATLSPGTTLPAATTISTSTLTTVAGLHWPEAVPVGMTFVATDSWPFRVLAPDRQNEPFLIFRDGPRWLLIRNRDGEGQPVPRSAITRTLQIAGSPGMLIKYLDGGFKLILQREGRAVQISGHGLPDEEVGRVAASLRMLSPEGLRVRLRQEAAGKQVQMTLLWPAYLPDGIELVPGETIALAGELPADPQADRYYLSFKGSDALIQVGGGTMDPPDLSGTEEQFTEGSLRGRLIVAQRRYLLIVNGGAVGEFALPRLPQPSGSTPKRLPLVQQGQHFIAAENIDREQFDRVVAGLIPVLRPEWEARGRGQNPTSLTYLWPSNLPDGYSIDLSAIQVAWDDFLLQGGLPFFQLTATGPDDNVVTIKGGREPEGEPFVMPEGADVERSTATIHGRTASVARTTSGSVLVWSENGSLYSITSRSLSVEQLIAIGEGLHPIDAQDFFDRIR